MKAASKTTQRDTGGKRQKDGIRCYPFDKGRLENAGAFYHGLPKETVTAENPFWSYIRQLRLMRTNPVRAFAMVTMRRSGALTVALQGSGQRSYAAFGHATSRGCHSHDCSGGSVTVGLGP